ncbi:hypothetical protein FQA39_LY02393 [Lamprigera yunnana]|nr:hypothetical protein FQA39_LY02393 [Lamprigera yunnana]
MAGATGNWVGTKLEDLYQGQDPWGFPVPPVVASRHHTILYQLPVSPHSSPTSAPKPYISVPTCHWDGNHVRMPYSAKNLFPAKDSNGTYILKQRWEIIQEALLQPINNSYKLEAAISKYNKRLPKLSLLHYIFEEVLVEDETVQFFKVLLPRIITLALQLPEILPGSLPLLKQGFCRSISLSQLQISSLLANAFLCTFPWGSEAASTYPGVNFTLLFAAHLHPDSDQSLVEKFKCVCHYFNRVIKEEPVGVVTFERKYFPKSYLPRWDKLENNIGNTKLHISSTGVIEDDGIGLLQVDFANKFIGGGVLGFGCVQEEIRFVICPELIISRLFTEQLGPTEALIVIGAERYSKYTGYGDSFMWVGSYKDTTPFDTNGRRKTSIVAIDAVHFGRPMEQYNLSSILREVNKAYVGFHSRLEGNLSPVATGNWGCGAFRGDPHLKSLIQLMACSAARRDLAYFTFGDIELREKIYEMYLFLASNQINICQLWKYLDQFSTTNVKSKHLFSYIQQAHFDSKNQLSIKDFFCFNKKKTDKSGPSTSTANSSPTKNLNVPTASVAYDELKEIVVHSSQKDFIDSDIDVIECSQNENAPLSLSMIPQEMLVKSCTVNNLEDNLNRTAFPSRKALSADDCTNKNNEVLTCNHLKEKASKTKEDNAVVPPETNTNALKRKITDYFDKMDKC